MSIVDVLMKLVEQLPQECRDDAKIVNKDGKVTVMFSKFNCLEQFIKLLSDE